MFRLTVQDVFFITGRGTVVTGQVEEGSVSVGDEVTVDGRTLRVDGIEAFRKRIDSAGPGDSIGLLFSKSGRDDFKRGDVITGEAGGFTAPAPPASTGLESEQMRLAEEALGRRPKRRYPWSR